MYCYKCMNQIGDDGYCPNCRAQNVPELVPHHLKPGTILNNKYIVGNAIGEGGFGITYIGRDLTLDVKVAVKEYYPSGYVNRNNAVDNEITPSMEKQRAIYQKGKDRFLQEARSLAKFSDEKGVVLVRDYFESWGSAYIVMEYLDGITLHAFLKQNHRIDAETIFRLALPIIASLERMHSAGIIHRDISPDNIMYLRSGDLKLMDFGSARFFTNGEKEMSVLVKQGYAPEEQYRKNGSQGPWTDVYGLCATIYKCITGVVPEDSLNRLHFDSLKRPSELGVAIDPQLENTLMYGLAVRQNDRCRDMTELKRLVTDALEHRPTNAYAPYPVRNAEGGAYPPVTVDNRMLPAEEDTPQQTYGDNYFSDTRNPYPGNMYPGSPYPENQYQANRYAGNQYPSNQYPGTQYPGTQYGGYPPQKQKKSAIPAVIAVLSTILALSIGGLIYLLLTQNNNEPVAVSSSTEATAQVTEEASKPEESAMDSDVSEEEQPSEEESWDDDSKTKDEQEMLLTVPDVKGMSYDEAKKKLTDMGFKTKTEWKSSSAEKYEVLDQSPDSASKAEKGSVITIYLSEGPKEATKAPSASFDPKDPHTGSAAVHSANTTLYCRTDSVSLRKRATRYSDAITMIKENETVTYLDTVFDFYKVKSKSGDVGYVLAEFFSTDSDASYRSGDGNFHEGSTLFSKASGDLHVRESPSTSAKAVHTLNPRDRVTLIRITTEGKYGFDYVYYYDDDGEKHAGYVLDKFLTDDFEATLLDDDV